MGKKKKKDARSDELTIASDEDWVNLKNMPGTIWKSDNYKKNYNCMENQYQSLTTNITTLHYDIQYSSAHV